MRLSVATTERPGAFTTQVTITGAVTQGNRT
jgi:hypothetical protein